MSRKLAMQLYGNRLVNDLQVYLRSLHTHQANNQIVSRARDALLSTLREHFEKEPQSTLQVQLLPEETFINNTLLPIAMQDFGRIKELTERLRGMGVGELVSHFQCDQGRSVELRAERIRLHARADGDGESILHRNPSARAGLLIIRFVGAGRTSGGSVAVCWSTGWVGWSARLGTG